MKYSIIIPTYNSSGFIESTLENLNVLMSSCENLELVFVDDCSTDNTVEILKKWVASDKSLRARVQLVDCSKNSGPGICRNIGIGVSTGERILFLDSDDQFSEEVIEEILKNDKSDDADIICFNWANSKNDNSTKRTDLSLFGESSQKILREYLRMRIDHSVIYTVFNKKLIELNNIFFREGYHEDVDFMFKIFHKANSIKVIDKVIYYKNNRNGSIINTFNEKHVQGFMDAYLEIKKYVSLNKIKGLEMDFVAGVHALTTTLLRRAAKTKQEDKKSIYKTLFKNLTRLDVLQNKDAKFQSKYSQIQSTFLEKMNRDESIDSIDGAIRELEQSSWSCFDIHNSIFLGPDEVRACCKRYFKDGKQKGDVILMGKSAIANGVSLNGVMDAKKNLHQRINSEKAPECDSCPFLKFKKWGEIEPTIDYISFEYHSKCNMRCQYCSETYYGGKAASYNIEETVDDFIANGALDECSSVIWGGGEPVLDKGFEPTIQKIGSTIPGVRQRVITNSTIYSKAIQDLIDKDQCTVVTSIDAGTEETFKRVRKNKLFNKVFENVEKYGAKNPSNITLKYIIQDNNQETKEIMGFLEKIKLHNLKESFFQISFDFKEEKISDKVVVFACMLYACLYNIGCRKIYFDDLFYQRDQGMVLSNYEKVKTHLEEHQLSHCMANPFEHSTVTIWGAGDKAEHLLTKTNFFKQKRSYKLVDHSPDRIDQSLKGHRVEPAEVLISNSDPVIFASYIHNRVLREKFDEMRLDPDRIISKLII